MIGQNGIAPSLPGISYSLEQRVMYPSPAFCLDEMVESHGV